MIRLAGHRRIANYLEGVIPKQYFNLGQFYPELAVVGAGRQLPLRE